ncbi:MAG: cation-transporting P-type ATPase [Saprospiraceae bacterium]|nr:cation-transporting P-type ATPase [Saprospiraceae bacterium]
MITGQGAYLSSIAELERQLAADAKTGLSNEEAAARLKRFGPNALQRYKSESWVHILMRQFLSPLAGVLVVAVALSLFFGEWLEGIAIGVVILMNVLIGFFMERQAQHSMEALRSLAQTHANVWRDGTMIKLTADQIVPGDLLFVEAGDVVAADARVVAKEELQVSEALLTGESMPVTKHAEPLERESVLAERANMVFRGTTAVHGNARVLVVATGAATELGEIVRLTATADKEVTPLEKKLQLLSKKLILFAFLAAVVVVVAGLVQGKSLLLVIETAIALAIAAIPEGLPVVATIALAGGMLRLTKHKVIVKRLSAVETLGEVDVILTDKTGTLTENKLAVRQWIAEGFSKQQDADRDTHPAYPWLLKVATLCNNAQLALLDSQHAGDPLEIALLEWSEKNGVDRAQLHLDYPRIGEKPFESETRLMLTQHKQPGKDTVLICAKGAPEAVLARCSRVMTPDGVAELFPTHDWLAKTHAVSAEGLRVLAMAYGEEGERGRGGENNLIFLGLIAFYDPPRSDVKEALATCRKAGIRVVMVTGDHPAIAGQVAQMTGLVHRSDVEVMQGKNISESASLSKSARNKLLKSSVFARVSPADKLELADMLQSTGKVVGMTGDGVNDAPALKKADIGIAMGMRGSEAAKEAADLVLQDDSFPAIVMAIKQGRVIYDNIRQFVIYLLSCNLSELLVVTIAAFANLATPLLPLQILFLNMITDVFPALALGLNPASKHVMRRPPRSQREAVITPAQWRTIGVYAAVMTFSALGALMWGTHYMGIDAASANNITFYALILAQLLHVFNMPVLEDGFWRNSVTRNRFIWMALPLCVSLTILAYAIPVTRRVLQLNPLHWEEWIVVGIAGVAPVLVIQVLKRLKWIQ